jgi:hypothetical protein
MRSYTVPTPVATSAEVQKFLVAYSVEHEIFSQSEAEELAGRLPVRWGNEMHLSRSMGQLDGLFMTPYMQGQGNVHM